MRKSLALLAIVSISLFGLSSGAQGDVWVETTRADFANGEALGGLNPVPGEQVNA